MLVSFIVILCLHFIADFLCQSDWMAVNKSKNWKALTLHVMVYSAWFGVAFGWQFGLITFVTHWLTDFVTSRITSRLWAAEERHWFFVMIGLDQLIHYITLLVTWNLLLSPWGQIR